MTAHLLQKFDLTGRTAVVTGATRGLGRAFAAALGEMGAGVVLVGRDRATVAGAEQDLVASGVDALGVVADVTERDAVERLLETSVQRFGRVDILINNAGACIHAPALEVTDEQWQSVIEVNLHGVWLCSQVFGRHMVGQRSGNIVNIGSMSGAIVNRPQWQPAYNASKAAVHHLTRSLAAEWAPFGVRVNALAPGYVRTDMSPVDDPRFRRNWIEDTPLLRAATPDELTPAVIYLASDASSFVTGSVLMIDGGYTVY